MLSKVQKKKAWLWYLSHKFDNADVFIKDSDDDFIVIDNHHVNTDDKRVWKITVIQEPNDNNGIPVLLQNSNSFLKVNTETPILESVNLNEAKMNSSFHWNLIPEHMESVDAIVEGDISWFNFSIVHSMNSYLQKGNLFSESSYIWKFGTSRYIYYYIKYFQFITNQV